MVSFGGSDSRRSAGAREATVAAMNWSDLADELEAWRGEGRMASLWWRDDDAVAPAPALDRLAGLAHAHRVTVGLAVIPALAHSSIAPWLESVPAEVLQHGWAHDNHAAMGEKKTELGHGRDAEASMRELEQGFGKLRELFGHRFQPVLVPPWNRIDPVLIPRLRRAGFGGLSVYGPRSEAEPAPGLRQTNCHVDVVDWRGGRGFAGRDRVLGAVVDHLGARRERRVDPDEPTGLLTHHAVHDEPAWSFIARLVEVTRQHPAVRWLAPGEAILGRRAIDPGHR